MRSRPGTPPGRLFERGDNTGYVMRFCKVALFCVGLCLMGPFEAVAQEELPIAGMADVPRLLATEQYDEARAIVRAATQRRADAALHFAHLEGLILAHQGRYDEAIQMFRSVLTAEPNFTPSRVELSKLLFLTGQAESALRQIETVQLGTDDPGLRRLAQGLRNRMMLDRPYGFSGYVGILPSTNVNKATDNVVFNAGEKEFQIDEDSRRKSGVGVATGGSAFRSWRLSDVNSLVWSGSADIKKYGGSGEFDEAAVSSSLVLDHRIGASTVSFGPTADFLWQAWRPYAARYGVTLNTSQPIGERTALYTNVLLMKQDYVQLDYRDGWLASGTATVRHMFSPSLSLAATGSVVAERTQKEHLDHNDYRLLFQLDKEWSGGLLTTVIAGGGQNRYLGDFPGTTTERRDERWSAGGRLAHRGLSFNGFAPQLKYEYINQKSNISFYDYASHDFGLTLIRNF